MIVQLIKVKGIEKSGYDFKQIVAKKSDGSTYTKDVIMGNSTADIINELDKYGEGDFIELKYDDSRYKNVASVRAADGFPEESGPKKNYSRPQAPQNSGGGTRGDDTNRASAIYLAKDLVMKEFDGKDLSSQAASVACIQLAETIFKYIKFGDVPTGAEIVSPKDMVPENPR